MRAASVHPHARGERWSSWYPRCWAIGSSPRPWGTRAAWCGADVVRRFIPTPVGNARRASPPLLPRAVHPHARGERADRRTTGSRPRRFIPTPVGNADGLGPPQAARTVHPHARGERGHGDPNMSADAGSSPRPWGTRHGERGFHAADRFIPTPVGNAHGRAVWLRGLSVHPHARGERHHLTSWLTLAAGSSPRPWGTLAKHHPHCCPGRFIPTPVGNARPSSPSSSAISVHPHARGERAAGGRRAGLRPGSSPRPWGTLRGDLRDRELSRFIPTPVGNAAAPCRRPCSTSVHPHARGERSSSGTRRPSSVGSSPRPWGTLQRRELGRRDGRFIPTPVGNATALRRPFPPSPVHPHARGERGPPMLFDSAMIGSSPRPWGTPSGGLG